MEFYGGVLVLMCLRYMVHPSLPRHAYGKCKIHEMAQVSRCNYAIVGSDSGRIIILDYDPKTSSSVKLHQETYGKSRARRIVPGQYLATAMEKAKLVYILNCDPAANLTISSPLEAHKNTAIIHHIVGLDVGFENPMFAAWEVYYTESDQDPAGEAFNNAEKMLTYYELDLGLSHVVRKWSEPTDPRTNLLVQVPGGQLTSSDRFDGPSRVFVCENHIIYRHMDAPQHRVPIPRRKNPLEDPKHGLITVDAVMHKMKGAFCALSHKFLTSSRRKQTQERHSE